MEVLREAKGGVTPELVIWALFFGFSLALVFALFSKRYMGKFVHTLLSEKIDSPEKAKTLKELGYGNNIFVRMALVGKTAYSGLIFEKNEAVGIHGNSVVPIIRYKIDYASARFYIPKVLMPRAAIRYEKKGTHIVALLVGVAVFFLLAMLAIYYYPTVESFIRETIVQ